MSGDSLLIPPLLVLTGRRERSSRRRGGRSSREVAGFMRGKGKGRGDVVDCRRRLRSIAVLKLGMLVRRILPERKLLLKLLRIRRLSLVYLI